MSDVKFSKDELDGVVYKIGAYFSDEFDQEVGGFDSEFLIEFFAKEIGPFL